MKTASASSFNKTKKHGVEKDKPQHYAQMQVYMHLLKLTRALYMVVNKDNDELYTERIRYDAKKAQALIDKAQSIISATNPPERISDKPESFACKFCDARELCHGTSEVAVDVPALSCRQCVHATPIEDGRWACTLKDCDATEPCDEHLFLPGLINFAQPTDSLTNEDGSDVIEFTTDEGIIWQHGPDGEAGQYSSSVLMTTPSSLILPSIPKPKGDGKAGPNLEARYNTELDDVEVVWKGAASDARQAFADLFDAPMDNPNATQSGEGWDAAEFAPQGIVIFYGNKAEIRTKK